ncbi:hypothetical protein PPEP_b0082 [Pseudoalteromonas peptidolytica F12-50-A1]|uniref:Uncharacterized protein n=1 Tax=Pseudoalteromonas peptidolytica F12-50-A1 TaxID=1315280 RepID=A0A8I0MZX6_9GAMM|nr:hypothetical protein [Pseudoalteromonas peptidolytica F12-50-A1]
MAFKELSSGNDMLWERVYPAFLLKRSTCKADPTSDGI